MSNKGYTNITETLAPMSVMAGKTAPRKEAQAAHHFTRKWEPSFKPTPERQAELERKAQERANQAREKFRKRKRVKP